MICPMMEGNQCSRELCAWFNVSWGSCSVKVISMVMDTNKPEFANEMQTNAIDNDENEEN